MNIHQAIAQTQRQAHELAAIRKSLKQTSEQIMANKEHTAKQIQEANEYFETKEGIRELEEVREVWRSYGESL